ncbi:hypothetical protein P7C70_g1486, partial [Phenoliferia sp. Uapishka_3]
MERAPRAPVLALAVIPPLTNPPSSSPLKTYTPEEWEALKDKESVKCAEMIVSATEADVPMDIGESGGPDANNGETSEVGSPLADNWRATRHLVSSLISVRWAKITMGADNILILLFAGPDTATRLARQAAALREHLEAPYWDLRGERLANLLSIIEQMMVAATRRDEALYAWLFEQLQRCLM